jgi:hypothetical protein
MNFVRPGAFIKQVVMTRLKFFVENGFIRGFLRTSAAFARPCDTYILPVLSFGSRLATR